MMVSMLLSLSDSESLLLSIVWFIDFCTQTALGYFPFFNCGFFGSLSGMLGRRLWLCEEDPSKLDLGFIFGATFGGFARTGGGASEDEDDEDEVIISPFGAFMLAIGETMELVWLWKEEMEFTLSLRFNISFSK